MPEFTPRRGVRLILRTAALPPKRWGFRRLANPNEHASLHDTPGQAMRHARRLVRTLPPIFNEVDPLAARGWFGAGEDYFAIVATLRDGGEHSMAFKAYGGQVQLLVYRVTVLPIHDDLDTCPLGDE